MVMELNMDISLKLLLVVHWTTLTRNKWKCGRKQ